LRKTVTDAPGIPDFRIPARSIARPLSIACRSVSEDRAAAADGAA
jgi:hypothetical protein